MKKRLLGLAVTAHLVTAMLLAVAPVAAAGSAFAGTWTSIDNDGSFQMLTVSGGNAPSVTYQDFFASSCQRDGSPSTHWVSAGQGTVDGDTLFVDFHKSGCGRLTIGAYADAYTYDAGSDTLTDTFGIVWERST